MASYPSADLPDSWASSSSSSHRDVGCSLFQSGMNADSTSEGVPLQYKGFSCVESATLSQQRRHFPNTTPVFGTYVPNAAENGMDPYVSKFSQMTHWQMSSIPHSTTKPEGDNHYMQFYDSTLRNSYQLPDSSVPDPQMQVQLCDKELWEQFSRAGTEMIVTKTGRRMFPGYRIKISGLDKDAYYCVMMDIVNVDDHRYKFQHGEWTIAGRGEPHLPQRFFLHPDSPANGAKWMSEVVSFHKVKLTNSVGRDVDGKIVLNSMHRYQPRIHIVRTNDTSTVHLQRLCTFAFPQTVFITVTAYQNPEVTKLKIDNNPFAKGFREDGARAKKPRSDESFDHFTGMNLTSQAQYGYAASRFPHTPVVTVGLPVPQHSESSPGLFNPRQLHPCAQNQHNYIPELLDEVSLQFQGQAHSSNSNDNHHNWTEH